MRKTWILTPWETALFAIAVTLMAGGFVLAAG
jgi:hypothetical protein